MPNPIEEPSPGEELLRRRVKAELRKRLRALRKTTPESACAERSSRIVAHLVEHPAIAAARSVALFWPIVERHEVDLRPLDASLRARGVRLYYPAMESPTSARPDVPPTMTFREVVDAAALAEAGSGFAEPPADAHEAARGELDAIVVPAIALAPSGHRIGYGAGFYDRTLPRFAPPATTLAVAFEFQMIAEIPVTEGDVAVDWIVTDRRVDRREP